MKPRAGTMGAAFTRRPRRRLRVATIGFQCVAVVGFVACAALLNYFRTEHDLPDEHELDGHAYARRALEGDSSSMTPKNAFSLQQMRHGAVLLNLLCLLYMFVGIAIICDDYFVSSLELICERWGISDDVAGATFMAAGGSAPEFATSMLGVFAFQSDVVAARHDRRHVE